MRALLSSLTRHKLTVLLMILQVALTCAIVCNAVFMVTQRATRLRLISGVDEHALVLIESIDPDTTANPQARIDTDLAALRGIAGVQAAAAVDALPFNGDNWSNGIATAAGGEARLSATAFNGTPGELTALNLHLIEGRDFRPDEYIPMDSAHAWAGINHVPSTIVTRALAQRLFPGQEAVGKLIYPGDQPVRIVGVIDHLLRPNLDTSADNEYSTLFPMLPDNGDVTYVLRTDPAQRDRVLAQATAALDQLYARRIVRKPQRFDQLRGDYFQRDRSMLGLLLAAMAGLLLVTAVGIAGLASFWVQQRRRSIGIRRAIGATRRDILRYFQAENFIIVSAGIILGIGLAYALNVGLMTRYELPRLPPAYVPIGALLLWLLGQGAVLGPALRAAAVPPVVATRNE